MHLWCVLASNRIISTLYRPYRWIFPIIDIHTRKSIQKSILIVSLTRISHRYRSMRVKNIDFWPAPSDRACSRRRSAGVKVDFPRQNGGRFSMPSLLGCAADSRKHHVLGDSIGLKNMFTKIGIRCTDSHDSRWPHSAPFAVVRVTYRMQLRPHVFPGRV